MNNGSHSSRCRGLPTPRALPCAARLAGLLSLLLLCACVSPPPSSPPLAPGIRDSLGQVGVLAFSSSHRVSLELPLSSSEKSSDAAGLMGTGMLAGIRDSRSADPQAVMIALAWLPAGMLVGGLYGSLTGETDASLVAAEKVLGHATAEQWFDFRLLRQVSDEIAARRPQEPAPALIQVPISSVREELPLAMIKAHARPDIDSFLELKVIDPSLAPHREFGSRLCLSVHVRVRLLSRSGGQLYYDYLEYNGASHSLKEWMGEDHALLLAELGRAAQVLSEEIVAQLFLRDEQRPPSRQELRDRGLVRREPRTTTPIPIVYRPYQPIRRERR